MSEPQQQLQELYARAEELRRVGKTEDVAGVCRDILEIEPGSVAALKFLATWHLERQEYAKALDYLHPYCQGRPNEEQMLLGLGVALEETGELEEAKAALQRVIKINDANPFSYIYLGSVFEKLDEPELAGWAYSFGIDINPALKVAPERGELPVAACERVGKSNAFLKEAGRKLREGAIAKAKEKFPKGDFSRIEKSVWRKLHDAKIGLTNKNQQPLSFYIPHLDRGPWFDKGEFTFAENLEKETVFIRNEVLKKLRLDQDAKPYVQRSGPERPAWMKLAGSRDWSAVHFYNGMRKQAAALKRFPYTAKVLDKLPLFRIEGNPVEAMLAILKPGAKVPPHFGVSNARLRVYLPLVAAEGCKIKTGHDVHEIRSGKVMIFDDTFPTAEANESSEVRIVLVAEIWHPDLREEERAAVEHLYTAYEKWMSGRDYDALLNA